MFTHLSQNIHKQRSFPVRYFWEYVNMMFNKPDQERIKTLGPDRACAEWVLRNGGKVTWSNGKQLADYNLLPPESQSVPKVVTIDGSESSISHYGFAHLSMYITNPYDVGIVFIKSCSICRILGGCTMLQRIILHDNKYIDDRAMKGLEYGKDTLEFVQVSKCYNVTDVGVKEIKLLTNLKTLVLFNLSGVSDLEECKQYLKSQMPNCKVLGN